MTLAEILAALPDLQRAELRDLAWQTLLRCDGPDHVDGDEGTTYTVRVNDRPTLSFRIFVASSG